LQRFGPCFASCPRALAGGEVLGQPFNSRAFACGAGLRKRRRGICTHKKRSVSQRSAAKFVNCLPTPEVHCALAFHKSLQNLIQHRNPTIPQMPDEIDCTRFMPVRRYRRHFWDQPVLALSLLAALIVMPTVNSAAEPAVPYYQRVDGFPTVNMFAPGRWGIAQDTVVNPTDRNVSQLSTHFFPRDSSLQFARELWLPQQARRSSWYPLLPPRRSVSAATPAR